MTLKIDDVITAISGINVSGVVILDVDKIPQEGTVRASILFPNPDTPITGVKFAPQTFGNSATAAHADVNYTLNYVFLLKPVGEGRGVYQALPELINKIMAILDACVANFSVTGAVDIKPRVDEVGPGMTDPAGNQYWGCNIMFDVLEFYEVR